MNAPKNVTLALPTKRFLSFAIDFILAAIIGFVLFFFWGNKDLYVSLKGEELWQEAMEFYGTSHLIEVDKNEDGSWAKTYNELSYDVEPSSNQSKAGYELYLDATYLFYTDFLINNEHIDSVNGVAAKDYYSGYYFCTEIIGLPSDLSSINKDDRTTYTSKNGYWEYAFSSDGSEVDVNAKPVVAEAYKSLLSVNDKETLTKYYKLFIDGSNANDVNGIFYDASVLLGSQSYLVPINNAYIRVNWIINAVSFSLPLVVFFLLVPFVTPNGETLGNLLTSTGYVKKNGAKIKFWQRLAHPWVTAICLCPFVFVPSTYRMFALMGVIVLLFVDFAFALRDKTGMYRTLEDRVCGTLFCDKKKTKILKNDLEAIKFEEDHDFVETSNNEIVKTVDSNMVLKEKSIINEDILSEFKRDDSPLDDGIMGDEGK